MIPVVQVSSAPCVPCSTELFCYHRNWICTSIGLVSKNKLQLNTSKTKEIVYHRPRLSRHIIPPPLPDIEQMTSAKILGVILSDTLSPTPHIRTTAWSGEPLMGLFARVAKLGSGAYGARHARVSPSVTLIHTSLSQKERGRAASTLNAHRRASLWCCATLYLSHPWGRVLGQPVRQASALVREGGTCHLVKRKELCCCFSSCKQSFFS